MKIQIGFKTPDAVYYATNEMIDDEEEKQIQRDLLEKWISNGEYVRIEFDTDTMTAKVLNA